MNSYVRGYSGADNMDLSPDQQFATNWARGKGVLNSSETATNGLLDSRLQSNAGLNTEYRSALSGFRNTGGVRPTTVASQNSAQKDALYTMTQGQGAANSSLFNPYRDKQMGAIDNANNAFSNITAPKINNFRGYDQGTSQQFMNPYIKDVINNNANESKRREAERRNGIDESFAEAGGFGSTALGLERSRNASESERGISEMDAQLRAQGFDMATGRNMDLYNNDRADDFSRQTTNANNDMQAQLARAGGFMQTASAYGGGLNSAMQLDTYGREVGQRNTDRQLFAGDRVQQQNQGELDGYYAQRDKELQSPYQSNAFLAQLLQQYPNSRTTTSNGTNTGTSTNSTPGVGFAQGALGGALAGSSFGGGSSALPWQAAGNVNPRGGYYK